MAACWKCCFGCGSESSSIAEINRQRKFDKENREEEKRRKKELKKQKVKGNLDVQDKQNSSRSESLRNAVPDQERSNEESESIDPDQEMLNEEDPIAPEEGGSNVDLQGFSYCADEEMCEVEEGQRDDCLPLEFTRLERHEINTKWLVDSAFRRIVVSPEDDEWEDNSVWSEDNMKNLSLDTITPNHEYTVGAKHEDWTDYYDEVLREYHQQQCNSTPVPVPVQREEKPARPINSQRPVKWIGVIGEMRKQRRREGIATQRNPTNSSEEPFNNTHELGLSSNTIVDPMKDVDIQSNPLCEGKHQNESSSKPKSGRNVEMVSLWPTQDLLEMTFCLDEWIPLQSESPVNLRDHRAEKEILKTTPQIESKPSQPADIRRKRPPRPVWLVRRRFRPRLRRFRRNRRNGLQIRLDHRDHRRGDLPMFHVVIIMLTFSSLCFLNFLSSVFFGEAN